MTSVFDPEWDAEQDQPPFRWRRARIGRQAGSQKLGASMYDLPPGASSCPLHIHHANEELVVVLAGRPTLRTLDEKRELEPGEVIACPAGRDGCAPPRTAPARRRACWCQHDDFSRAQ